MGSVSADPGKLDAFVAESGDRSDAAIGEVFDLCAELHGIVGVVEDLDGTRLPRQFGLLRGHSLDELCLAAFVLFQRGQPLRHVAFLARAYQSRIARLAARTTQQFARQIDDLRREHDQLFPRYRHHLRRLA